MIITEQNTPDTVTAEQAERETSQQQQQQQHKNREADRMEIEYRKYVEGRVAAKFRVAADCTAKLDEMLAQAGHASTAHGNARAVMIWGDLNAEAYAERVRDHGAAPITSRVFQSAKAASHHFGYGWDAVGQALGRAKERGQDVAVVAGVPVRWADEVPGID